VQLIQRFVEALGKSPVALRRVLGFLSSFWLQWLPTKSKRITGENLRLAFPYMQSSTRRKLLRASLRDLAEKFFDLLATWIQSEQVVRKWVKTSDGLSDFMLACENGPTLILLPHLGNWELFGIWLSGYRSYTAMFRPLRLNVLSVIVRGARERGGNSLVVASHIGVKALLKGLRQGETVIILPDQTPYGNLAIPTCSGKRSTYFLGLRGTLGLSLYSRFEGVRFANGAGPKTMATADELRN
jgi:KDO2-lipid IV(A) lauroyltransferase